MSANRQKEVQDLKLCGLCEQPSVSLKACLCGSVWYCGTACQTAAWSDHMAACKLLRKGKEKERKKVVKTAAPARGSGSGLGDMGSLLNALMPQQPQPQPQRYSQVNMYNACGDGRHEELQKILLQKGLDVNWGDPYEGITAACISAQQGHAECLSLLILNGADASKAGNSGTAPIHSACQNASYACVEILLDANGVDVNLPMANKFGCTPAIVASQNGHVKILALLLARGGGLDLADNYGITAAHYASQYGHLQVLQLLVKRGANLSKRDVQRHTPLDTARMNKQSECVDLLLSAGATGADVEDLDTLPEAAKVGTAAASVSLCFALFCFVLSFFC
jgi:ankyrin repeat protein